MTTETATVTAASDIPDPVVGHRLDYWTWVEKHADTASRDILLALRDHWRMCNAEYFGGVMLEPYITLTEPSMPRIYGQCCSISSWGSRLEIRLRPSLLDGTHPDMAIGSRHAAGRMAFVKDVLMHEQIHQYVQEHQPHVNENSYHGHGPVFTAHCNRIGAILGLPEVVVRNRSGSKLAKSPQWPHCVAPPDRYGGAYVADSRSRVTARTVTVPPGFNAEAITPVMVGDDAYLDIEFVPSSGDGKWIWLRLPVDTAYQLAEFILDDGEADA